MTALAVFAILILLLLSGIPIFAALGLTAPQDLPQPPRIALACNGG